MTRSAEPATETGGNGEAPEHFQKSPVADEGPFHVRHRLGLYAAPLVALIVWMSPLAASRPEAHRLAAVGAAVLTLWISEAVAPAVAALAGASACVVLRVAPAREVFAPFADPLIFLFIGAFVLARGLFRHGLDRRLAYAVLSARWVGASPLRTLVAFGAATTFLSFWIGNAAVTAMMCPIAVSIVARLSDPERPGGGSVGPRFATAILLMTTFGASVGGLATPVGAAPNIIGIGFLEELAGIRVSFLRWCAFGVPAAVAMFLFLAAYLGWLSRDARDSASAAEDIPVWAEEWRRLGPWTRGQRSVALACGLTVVLWLVPGFLSMVLGDDAPLARWWTRAIPEPIAALLGALTLFALPGDDGPAMTWDEASRIDWGVILLFGGGMSLGALAFKTGLAEATGRGLLAALPWDGEFALLCTATIVAALVSEVTSNTASANMVVPVVIAVAQGAGVNPLAPALGATLGSGMGFMLPISTASNAIVYGSGLVPLRRMAMYGLALDIVGTATIIVVLHMIIGR